MVEIEWLAHNFLHFFLQLILQSFHIYTFFFSRGEMKMQRWKNAAQKKRTIMWRMNGSNETKSLSLKMWNFFQNIFRRFQFIFRWLVSVKYIIYFDKWKLPWDENSTPTKASETRAEEKTQNWPKLHKWNNEHVWVIGKMRKSKRTKRNHMKLDNKRSTIKNNVHISIYGEYSFRAHFFFLLATSFSLNCHSE